MLKLNIEATKQPLEFRHKIVDDNNFRIGYENPDSLRDSCACELGHWHHENSEKLSSSKQF